MLSRVALVLGLVYLNHVVAKSVSAEPLAQEPNTWVKRSPLKDGPPSPALGYETSLGYDPVAKKLIRWAGHNQGGGGEQNAETWVYDVPTGVWQHKEPNLSPPGVCCAQQNVFAESEGRFLRFTSFSGSHGWQWFREIYLSNSSVWSYDLATNTWRDMRPLPSPRLAPLRCASWDSDAQVAVVFGGEGSSEGTIVYDPYTNTWTRRKPPVEPEGRSGGNMAFDARRRRHILFGSQFSNDAHTWAYDIITNEWRDLKPTEQPPTDKNDAVMAYDSVNNVVVALVRVVDERNDEEVTKAHLETWTFDVGKNLWKKMNPPREPDGWGNRRNVMTFIPDQNLILLEHYANPTERVSGVDREQQIWTYRTSVAPEHARPTPPHGVSVTTTASSATVSWQRIDPGVVEDWISREDGPTPWTAGLPLLINFAPGERSLLVDRVKPGTIYYYHVSVSRKVGDRELSARSLFARTQPRIVEDAVVSVISQREVRLSWKPPIGKDAVVYHVERAPAEVYSEDQILRLKKDTAPLEEPSVGAVKAIGPFVRLTKTAIKEPAFTDDMLDLTKPELVGEGAETVRKFQPDQLDPAGKPYRYAVYAYRIRAVNALGVESGPSPYFLTIPGSPQHVLSKEDGEKCHLKWAASAEAGLRGYRVYRMEGPKQNGLGQKVTRLTTEPIADNRYTDDSATRDTKRYWVVAVDALGQEGFPSAPTWHYRQFRDYYKPFVGEWHQ